jgi:glutamine synthetase
VNSYKRLVPGYEAPVNVAWSRRNGSALVRVEITAESELVLRTLGEHTFNRFVEIKRQEWEDYRVQVTPWELERYLGIL